jgi:myo-inositol-1(or 4)-monophosphatase
VDPLDGTTNFRHSYPFFCVSIGVLLEDKPYVAVVYDPIRDELFTATKGGGAFLNGRRIRVSQVSSLKESLLVTGFAYSVSELQEKSMDLFRKLSFMTHGVRRDGAAALDLCYVAAGRLDAFWEFGLSIWDVAAGSLIVQEAEGLAIDPFGGEQDLFSGRILASNQGIKSELLDVIKQVKP